MTFITELSRIRVYINIIEVTFMSAIREPISATVSSNRSPLMQRIQHARSCHITGVKFHIKRWVIAIVTSCPNTVRAMVKPVSCNTTDNFHTVFIYLSLIHILKRSREL